MFNELREARELLQQAVIDAQRQREKPAVTIQRSSAPDAGKIWVQFEDGDIEQAYHNGLVSLTADGVHVLVEQRADTEYEVRRRDDAKNADALGEDLPAVAYPQLSEAQFQTPIRQALIGTLRCSRSSSNPRAVAVSSALLYQNQRASESVDMDSYVSASESESQYNVISYNLATDSLEVTEGSASASPTASDLTAINVPAGCTPLGAVLVPGDDSLAVSVFDYRQFVMDVARHLRVVELPVSGSLTTGVVGLRQDNEQAPMRITKVVGTLGSTGAGTTSVDAEIGGSDVLTSPLVFSAGTARASSTGILITTWDTGEVLRVNVNAPGSAGDLLIKVIGY